MKKVKRKTNKTKVIESQRKGIKWGQIEKKRYIGKILKKIKRVNRK